MPRCPLPATVSRAPVNPLPRHRSVWPLPALISLLLAAGCASTTPDEAERLSREGLYEEALAGLDAALLRRPDDAALRTAHDRQTDRVLMQMLARAEMALAAGRLDEADALAERARRLRPAHARLADLDAQRDRQRQRLRPPPPRTAQPLASPAPAAPAAPPAPLPPALAAAFQRPVSLEFREATLRQVFESLARTSHVNFVFDKDVRGDARVTIFLRQVALDEALRVILATQQLDRKLLNDNTVLVYPNTPAKQREHQELVTRTLSLGNAEAKQMLALVRTMVKTRDLHADERLNMLVVRDTPEVVRQVERLVATLDLPEPEVMLAVEVMEVASNRIDALGLNWPSAVQYGATGTASGALVDLANRASFTASIANPALLATLRGDAGSTNLLANPSIRARNREKARVQIGDKLPVFTTTATANVGVSTSVSYLDVGLKLDVEPTVQLDGDVTIKVALEVSSLLNEVAGPGGALAYRVGTRSSSTTLRLRDGETQVLAGLISDEDRQRAQGVPGLSSQPVLGRLFGTTTDTRNKTEVVMLITPRILRPLASLGTAATTIPSGTDLQPGAMPLRLATAARAGVAPGRGAGSTATRTDQPEPATPAAADAGASLLLAASPQARVGETVSVTLHNRSGLVVDGELVFDGQALQAAGSSGGAAVTAGAGRLPFQLPPRGQAVVVLRVLPPAAGQRLALQVSGLRAAGDGGTAGEIRVDGEAVIEIPAVTAAPAANATTEAPRLHPDRDAGGAGHRRRAGRCRPAAAGAGPAPQPGAGAAQRPAHHPHRARCPPQRGRGRPHCARPRRQPLASQPGGAGARCAAARRGRPRRARRPAPVPAAQPAARPLRRCRAAGGGDLGPAQQQQPGGRDRARRRCVRPAFTLAAAGAGRHGVPGLVRGLVSTMCKLTARRRGFTLIELIVVMAIVALLVSIAAPRYLASLDRARETSLRSSLLVVRQAIDQFAADRGRYPDSLAELVESRYLRQLPEDPLTGLRDGWVLLAPPPDSALPGAVWDLRSSAAGRSRDGVLYADW